MRAFIRIVLLSEAFAVATFGLGWWAVPIVAAAWALISSTSNAPRLAAICAAAGWATLLLLDVARGPVSAMGEKLGGVMNLPAAALYLLTLLFPASLAWSAATLIPRIPKRGT
ncbi:MAG: hypothetical protein ABI681_11020 [Gemmatimonadales bacterium]